MIIVLYHNYTDSSSTERDVLYKIFNEELSNDIEDYDREFN